VGDKPEKEERKRRGMGKNENQVLETKELPSRSQTIRNENAQFYHGHCPPTSQEWKGRMTKSSNSER
jgi:hypothetical protein